jgi:hypothetical protein
MTKQQMLNDRLLPSEFRSTNRCRSVFNVYDTSGWGQPGPGPGPRSRRAGRPGRRAAPDGRTALRYRQPERVRGTVPPNSPADLFAMTLRLIREYESAVQAATRAVAIYRAAGDRDGEASALIQLAAAQYDTGDYATATANLTVALEACRARQPVRRSQRPGPPRLGPAPRRRLPGRARQLGTHPGAIA